ncbi:hypothetical protein YE105_C1879 [Yersinia enterocolitica subsp. palearctica 105.5R(r)]|nr:hypothetical protein YE105_C1879 [Yersinia enterocolitica subsp. palearctica 105.5R(r)]
MGKCHEKNTTSDYLYQRLCLYLAGIINFWAMFKHQKQRRLMQEFSYRKLRLLTNLDDSIL